MPGLNHSRADRLARALLSDPPTHPAAAAIGLAYILQAAGERRSMPVLRSAADGVRRVVAGQGWRAEPPEQRMVQVADAVGTIRNDRHLQTQLLHVSYLACHAAMRTALAARQVGVVDELARVELGLDVALHHPSRATKGGGVGLQEAVSRWTLQVSAAVERPSVAVQQLAARTAGVVLVTVNDLAQTQMRAGGMPSSDYEGVLRPALAGSLQAWGEQHRQWSRFLSADQRVPRGVLEASQEVLAAAARVRAMSDPSSVMGEAVAAVLMVRHVATLSREALDQPGWEAPATTVAAALASVYSPASREMHPAWLELDRVAGRAPVAIPQVLMDGLTQTGDATRNAADKVAASSYLMLSGPTSIPGPSDSVRRFMRPPSLTSPRPVVMDR